MWIIFLGKPWLFHINIPTEPASKALAASYPKLENHPKTLGQIWSNASPNPEPVPCLGSFIILARKKGAMEKSWDGMRKKKHKVRTAQKNVNPPPKKKVSLKWQTPKSSKRIDNIDIYSENQWFFGVPQV